MSPDSAPHFCAHLICILKTVLLNERSCRKTADLTLLVIFFSKDDRSDIHNLMSGSTTFVSFYTPSDLADGLIRGKGHLQLLKGLKSFGTSPRLIQISIFPYCRLPYCSLFLAMYTAYLLVFLSVFDLTYCRAENCSDFNGSWVQNDPCDPDTDVSACCLGGIGSCQTNLHCNMSFNKTVDSCTERSWESPACRTHYAQRFESPGFCCHLAPQCFQFAKVVDSKLTGLRSENQEYGLVFLATFLLFVQGPWIHSSAFPMAWLQVPRSMRGPRIRSTSCENRKSRLIMI